MLCEGRKAKREHGLPILNLDLEMNFMCSHGRLMTRRERLLCKMMRDSSDTTARILDRFQVCDGDQLQKKDETSSFLVKLIGTPSGMPSFIYSPYTRRSGHGSHL
ncbi:putative cysteine-rich protein 2-binding protein-like [Homarus americanus]|uniref:Putative cysteine-rich protein 2-binding protein-like n=1 Tax=Homarus americanus TaxID=6706 RepID=A0A8J5TJD7_HOMAM|nr:putative cysteine-rich protein 2-binding protein-like [Homarus americanus]